MRFKLFENQKLRNVVCALIAVFSFNLMHAQSKKVAGTVTNESGEPLIGVSVSVKSTGKLTITDFDGNFVLEIEKGDILVADYLGYAKEEVLVKDQVKFNIQMTPDTDILEEVVVVGYGKQKQKEVTGAVANVKAEVLEKTTTSDIGSALQGQISGVTVTSSSGEPGSEANILIRGFSSLLDGQNKPLYVVDGIPYDNDPGLSVSEIESIDVLKDAASASIYGTRGAGGVILITTKQGKVGDMRINFKAEYGMQNITSNTPLLSGTEFLYTQIKLASDRNGTSYEEQWNRSAQNPQDALNNTNLENTILNDMAPIENYNLNISGGKKNLLYSFNSNYFLQEGILMNSDFKRLNLRSNVKYTSGKFKLTSGFTFRKDDRFSPAWRLLNQIYEYDPSRPAVNLNENDFSIGNEDDDIANLQNVNNTLRTIKQTSTSDLNFTALNVQMDYEVTKDLRITARAGGNYTNTRNDAYRPEVTVTTSDGLTVTPVAAWQRSSMKVTHTQSSKLTYETILNYNKEIGRHKFDWVFANSIEKSERKSFFAQQSLNGFGDKVTNLEAYRGFPEVGLNGDDYTRTLIGYLGRLQYNFAGKYLFSASVRRDGSSQFEPENAWGWFPSVSAGWNLAEENFWTPIKPIVKSFKVRASLGTTGNDRFSPYQTAGYIDNGFNVVFGDSNSDSYTEAIAYGATRVAHYNKDLKWETSVERNFGVDMSLFSNQLSLTADYYKAEKDDLLYPVLVQTSSGVGTSYSNKTVMMNVGNMTNTGLELAVKFRSRKGKFKWNTSATFSTNDNEITRTHESNPFSYLNGGYVGRNSNDIVTVITKGYEAGAFFLLQQDGIINTQEELDEYMTDKVGANGEPIKGVTSIDGFGPRLGDSKFKDTNNDGIINDDDKVYSGSGTPEFEAGWNFSANYEQFDFSMQWYGSFGSEIMNGNKAYAYQSGKHKDLFYGWSDLNTQTSVPQYRGTNNVNNNATYSYRSISDYFLEDGTFIRLRNIALGYTVPKKTTQKIGVNRLRFYIQAQNALTLTKYTGFDPEVGNNGLSTRGLDAGTYPMTAQYKVGLQLQF